MRESKLIAGPFKNYLILGVVATAFTLIFQGPNDFLFSFTLPVIDLVGVYVLYQNFHQASEKHFVFGMFIWALLLRVLAVFAMSYILTSYNNMPFLSYQDDYNYQNAAVAIMERWKMSGIGFYHDLKFSSDTYSGFPNFSAALMMVFGTSPLVPRMGNAVLSSITCLIAYAIIKLYSEKNMARLICTILVLNPLTISISAMQFKDTLLLFFIVINLYAATSIIRGHNVFLSVLLLTFSYVGCSFGRPAVIVPLAASLMIMILHSIYAKPRQGSLVLKILSVVILLFLLEYSYRTLSRMGFDDLEWYFESRYSILSEKDIQDSMAGVRSMSIAKYLGAPLYFIFGLFLPPPLLVSIEETINYSAWTILAHYAFLPFLVIALWNSVIHRKAYPIPFFLSLVFILLRIGQANSILSSFSPRQSMATLFIMYLLLPMYIQEKKRCEWLVFLVSLLIAFVYNIVRLYSHGML